MSRRTSSRRRKKKNSPGSLWPLVAIIVVAAGVLAALWLIPGLGEGQPESSTVVTTTTTTTATTTTTTTTITTTTTTTKATKKTTAVGTADDRFIDGNGLLQFHTDGRYVQADSYGGGLPEWNLMLVNDWNPLPDGYEDTVTYEKVHKWYRRLDSLEVDSRMVQALNDMMAAGRAAGISDLAVQSAHRTVATQKRLYWNEVDEHRAYASTELEAQTKAGQVVKRPGYSEHHTGLAVDVGGNGNFYLNQNFEKTAAFKWLIAHCHEYGFILRFPKDKEAITGVIYEPWHYRYVGVEAATYIMENGLCLEEYLEQTGK